MKRDKILAFRVILVWLLTLSLDGFTQNTSKFIIVDQFGYLPEAKKIAVIKNPQIGFDANESFTPGNDYTLVSSEDNEAVFTSSPVAWKNGQTDNSSGDKVWWFDFSEVETVGSYYVLDNEKNVKSFEFQISPSVYNEVLKHAVRTFFYQRVGHEKAAQYAGVGWADDASHMRSNQDPAARLFSDANNAATEIDVSGGWYDAGDLNKYTNWTANYITEMMKAYLEVPEAWGDDYNIPESGNGIPDLLDEAKWGVDHLMRLQKENGSVLSIVAEDHASPPSSAVGQSLYGPPNTSSTLNTSGALAISSKVFRMIGNDNYANQLEEKAIAAWNWAVANPNVLFRNNDSEYNSEGIGAGQQEEDDYQRSMTKLEAACFLFEITGDQEYQNYFDANYSEAHLLQWNYAYPYEPSNQEMLLYYASLPNATTSVANSIRTAYLNSMNSGDDNFPAHENISDPYRAHLGSYTWGSNATKSNKGNMFYNLINYSVDEVNEQMAKEAALTYVNYIHGVNPLNITFLTNMYNYGGDNCANEFYHTWFANGSAKWDRVGESTYGPAPGFLTGGSNPSYEWDGCCPSDCGGSNNVVCESENISPPMDQPDQKSYKDFNTSWPLNSWSVTENSCGYQIAYIKLLSKFVNLNYDCHGNEDGSASIDACGNCTGGDTGEEPITDPLNCQNEEPPLGVFLGQQSIIDVYPNPNEGLFEIQLKDSLQYHLSIIDMSGKTVLEKSYTSKEQINVMGLNSGSYLLRIEVDNHIEYRKMIKN